MTHEPIERDLVQLAYVSSAAVWISEDDVMAIETSARRHNGRLDLTGLLVFQGSLFYGILEGPRRRVFSRMEVIITDRRHSDLRILREEAVPTRRFSNWSLARLPDLTITDNGDAPVDFIVNLSRRLS